MESTTAANKLESPLERCEGVGLDAQHFRRSWYESLKETFTRIAPSILLRVHNFSRSDLKGGT